MKHTPIDVATQNDVAILNNHINDILNQLNIH